MGVTPRASNGRPAPIPASVRQVGRVIDTVEVLCDLISDELHSTPRRPACRSAPTTAAERVAAGLGRELAPRTRTWTPGPLYAGAGAGMWRLPAAVTGAHCHSAQSERATRARGAVSQQGGSAGRREAKAGVSGPRAMPRRSCRRGAASHSARARTQGVPLPRRGPRGAGTPPPSHPAPAAPSAAAPPHRSSQGPAPAARRAEPLARASALAGVAGLGACERGRLGAGAGLPGPQVPRCRPQAVVLLGPEVPASRRHSLSTVAVSRGSRERRAGRGRRRS